MKCILEAEYSAINTDTGEIEEFLLMIGSFENFKRSKKLVRAGKPAGSYVERKDDMVVIVLFHMEQSGMLCGIFKDPRLALIKNDELPPILKGFFEKMGFSEETYLEKIEVPQFNPSDN